VNTMTLPVPVQAVNILKQGSQAQIMAYAGPKE